MASKYDGYWEGRKADLVRLVQAAARGEPATLDCASIRPLGDRGSWRGKAVVKNRSILESRMAHMDSLGRLVARLGLCASHAEGTFVFTMDSRCLLHVTGERQPSQRPERQERSPEDLASNELEHTKRVDKEKLLSFRVEIDATAICVPSSACAEIHSLLEGLPFYTTPLDVPFQDGLYFFYEQGESSIHGPGGRIVRIGNHPASDHRLGGRLHEHYLSRPGAKNFSVFRRYLGGALMRRENPHNPCLAPRPGQGHWEKQKQQACERCSGYEQRVTEQLKETFKFRCVRIDDREIRNKLEQRLIATLAACEHCKPSRSWLGRYAYNEVVRRHGLWNSDYIGGPNMTKHDLGLFRTLVHTTAGAANGSDLSDTLLLIPCSGGKDGNPDPMLPICRVTDLISHENAGIVEEGRRLAFLKTRIYEDSEYKPAIAHYSGQPYKTLGFRELLIEHIRRGLHCLIVSGGYGLVRPEEPIHDYEAYISKTRGIWKARLRGILLDYVSRNGIKRTFGAFSREYAKVVPNSLTNEDWRTVPVYDRAIHTRSPQVEIPELVATALVELLRTDYNPGPGWERIPQ